jgi:capsular exopolysaccharide synthesis family protein
MIDLATAPRFATLVINTAKVSDHNPNDLLKRTTVTATPAGNGLVFTVSDPSAANAMKIANTFATQFPVYLQSQTPVRGKLLKAQQRVRQLQNEVTSPKKYGPFKIDPTTKQLILDSKGNPIPDPTLQAQVPSQLVAAKLHLQAVEQDEPNAREATFTQPIVANSATKTQPQVLRTGLIGLFVGLVLGVILAFVQDVLDTRIRSAEDVGRRLRIPLLARIPTLPRRFGRQAVMLAEPNPSLVPTSEAYRIAKLNLANLLERRNAKTLLFTSASDDEGTSQTVANMAIVLARAGRHVIVVDANMRSPMQAEFFGLDDRAGLSDVLSGRAKLADTLTAVEVSRVQDVDAVSNGHAHTEGILEVLPAGAPSADPAELLDTRTAADLLLALRQRADVVLVDAPAMLPVTDAMVLASKVDAVVVVSRARRASRPNVVALRRALDNCPAPSIGFVFTGDASGRRNDYGGSYVARPVGLGEEERDPREVGVL